VSATGLVVAALVCAAVTVAAQVPARAPPALVESVTVVPGESYRAGALGRFIYGDHYRDLWTAPLTVPVLSLDQYAGGSTVAAAWRITANEVASVQRSRRPRVRFRSIDKDPSPSLPPELRGTYAYLSCAISSARSTRAGPRRRPTARCDWRDARDAALAVMPDDPRLGEFRKEFAGMLGLIELPHRRSGRGHR
jgi:hypothetical protein